MSSRDYYCNNKFKFLKVDLEQKTTYNCHAATPHVVDLTWLSNNPGQLFNIPINVEERKIMLLNQRNKSCEQNCYRAEDNGAAGPRILANHTERTHTDVISVPETIDMTVGSDCNLSCSYCCREYSSSWRRDLSANSNYTDLGDNDVRYQLTSSDKILLQLAQKNKQATTFHQLMAKELSVLPPTLKTIMITGGEPFLNNSLLDILESTKHVETIKLFTGLGVSTSRFKRLAKQISEYKNVTLAVSLENIGPLTEFNRYGSLWHDVLKNIEILEKNNQSFLFHSTLSNLTIHGFSDFYRMFKHCSIEFDLVHQPTFMPIYVIDDHSKEHILSEFDNIDLYNKDLITKSINSIPSETQRQQTSKFLIQFSQRRPNLDLRVFPNTFLKWLDINVVQ